MSSIHLRFSEHFFKLTKVMTNYTIIGYSHLKRVNRSLFEYPVSIQAKGGLNVSQLTTDVFRQNQDVFFSDPWRE